MKSTIKTGIKINLEGHLKILEYDTRYAYDHHKPSRILLNQRNAIHKDNASVLLSYAMTHRTQGNISYMYFGNGGTTVDASGNVTFKTPNVTGLNQDLYNTTYFQLVDDIQGSDNGNQMALRHINSSLFSDMDIRCLVGQNQPFGQLSSDSISGINIDNQFYFNEIGLKTADLTLITHVIFSPILKEAARLLEIVYSIRAASEYVAPPTPPPPGPVLNCASNFVWSNDALVDTGGTPSSITSSLDNNNTLYISDRNNGTTGVIGISNTGSTLFTWNINALADSIDSWYGSAIVNRGFGYYGDTTPLMAPIYNGQYLISYFAGAEAGIGFERWFAILSPSGSGPPTVVGALVTDNLLGIPYVNSSVNFYETNNKTINDPILFMGTYGTGGFIQSFLILPSINAFITGIYKTGGYGSGGYTEPCQIPSVILTYIGTENLSSNLFFETEGTADNNDFPNGGWTLPDSTGGTNFYMYFNRSYMDFNSNAGGNSDVEINMVLQPAYPLGCVVKIKMGILNYTTLANAFISGGGDPLPGTPMYTVDNANWVDNNAVIQMPFVEEYTYISTGLPGGQDCFRMNPGLVSSQGNGIWWIILIMPGVDDDIENHGGEIMYERIRIFSYDQTTEIYTQILVNTCEIFNATEIAGTSARELYTQIATIIGGTQIYIAGLDSTSALAFFTEFGVIVG